MVEEISNRKRISGEEALRSRIQKHKLDYISERSPESNKILTDKSS